MKIIVAVPYLSNGGAERSLFNLAVFFLEQGHNVSMISSYSETIGEMNIPEKMKIFRLNANNPLTSPSFISTSRKLLKIFKEIKPDIVLSNSDYLNTSVLIAKKLSGQHFKVLISHQYHSSSNFKLLPFKNRIFLQLLQRVIGKYADAVAASSVGVAKDLAKISKLTYPDGKLSAIYNPIFDNSILDKSLETVTDQTFSKENINIISVGRLAPQKDFETLISAFALLLEQLPSAKLFIIGKGPDEQKLKAFVNDLSLNENIKFLGFKENPYAYVAKCDLFVMSSIFEGFGNVLVEAMSVGTNVVSTDCPSGPSEILQDGKFGHLAETRNAGMLADKMKEALGRPLPKAILVERAKEFSIQRSGDQYLALMQRLL